LLKPALARGGLRTVAATTWAEYKKYFENDAALKRRFQVVKVEEPTVDLAVRMMRGMAKTFEKHHKVRILEEAVEESVKLSARYISDRQLPDKSVSLLDTACARVALSQPATPAAVDDCTREIELLDVELGMLEREAAIGADHQERLQDVKDRKQAAQTRLAGLQKRWADEKRLAAEIQKVREKLELHAAAGQPGGEAKNRLRTDEQAKGREDLARLTKELLAMQGESPLVLPMVGSQAVAEIVSNWTGIPVGKMVLDEIKTVLALREKLEDRIVGQSHALEAVAQRI